MTLDDYLSQPGCISMAEFARRLEINADQVRQWRHQQDGRRPSPTNCAVIERATEGQVTCEELHDGVVWLRIPDAAWPWHKEGRPTVDITKSELVAAAAHGA